MKFPSFVALFVLLCLGGCASNAVTDQSTPDPTDALPTISGSAAPVAPSHEPEFPTGALTPITANDTHSRAVTSMAIPVDLWERIRRGFAMPDLDSSLVPDREQWYVARPNDLERMTERSRKYLFHIVEEIERRNMPTELAFLPFIESAFNPQAFSRARAAGMWQFIPSTGKLYRLKQNAFRDDRRDVLASTRAALDYLQKLYGMFGDWHLALAAYNWGEGNVGRAIAKRQRKGLDAGYLDLPMPMETRMYIPKLQAVKNIVARPEDFHVTLPHIDNHPYFDSVLIRRDIDVALAAKLAEVPLDDFKQLNPSLHRPVILAAGTPHILLPWDNAIIFQRNLDAFAGSRLASWTVWIAPTHMKPADAARRVNMSESDLRYVNRIPPNMTIRAGSTLLVPRPARQERDVTMRIADNGQLSLSRDVVLHRTLVKAGKNETVASIATRYHLNAASVADWNKVGLSAAFVPLQDVVVYLPARARAAAKSKPRRKSAPSRPARH